MRCKGIVKDNVVVVEEGVHLPDGAAVLITIQREEEVSPEERQQRQALVARMKAFGQRLGARKFNLGDLVLEGREELESRA